MAYARYSLHLIYPLDMTFRTLLFCTACLILTACGSGTEESDTPAQSEQLADAPLPFDDIAAALDAQRPAGEIAGMLLRDYAKVSNDRTGMVDPAAGSQYIELADRLATEAKGDTVAALPLYKAAEVHQALGNFRGAIDIFERVYREYPNFSKAGEALFMLGFTYDENLREYDKAREAYTTFLEKYPNNTFADDTEMLLSNLGKSDEEMLKSLQQ